jgi:xylan 1,4-beta-xylosidase
MLPDFAAPNELPFHFYFYHSERFKIRRWRNGLTFLLPIFNPVPLRIGEKAIVVSRDELFLIRGEINFLPELKPNDLLLCFELDIKYFDALYPNFSSLDFQTNPDKGSVANIRDVIIALYVETADHSPGHYLKISELLSRLGLLLLEICAVRDGKEQNTEFDARIGQLVDYIKEHFREKITLTDLSSYVHLNPQYLSRFFSRYTNVHLEDCIAQIRLQKSVGELCCGSQGLTEIALSNGFANQKAFAAACKKYLGVSPQVYRKKFKTSADGDENTAQQEQAALAYFRQEPKNDSGKDTLCMIKDKLCIDCSKATGRFSGSWRKIIGFMRASDALRSSLRDQLRTLQQEVPFEYVRFHGIFSDDMMVYNEDLDGKMVLNFNLIDELLDFLQEIKLKPYIELGYMPEKLASEKKSFYKWHANVSAPNDLSKWVLLIRSFLEHLDERYGKERIDSWLFEIWDEPDYGNRYYPEPKNLEFPFLKSTLKTLKEFDPDLQVGVLNLMDQALLCTDIIRQLHQSLNNYQWQPDFCAFSVYSFQYPDRPFGEIIKKAMDDLPFNYQPQKTLSSAAYGSERQFSESVDRIIRLLRQYPLAKKNYIDEWNLNPDPNDFLHDTCFKAPFIVKNVLNNCSKVDGMSYWALSDIFDEVVYTDSLTLHGGLGLMTEEGLRKPAYYAFLFLSKLGSSILFQNDYSVVTKNLKGTIQILLYNYRHFSNPSLPHRDPSVRIDSRYEIFGQSSMDVELELAGLHGKHRKKLYRVNRDHGSVYDAWIKMGAPNKLSAEEVQYLSKKSLYSYRSDDIYLVDGYSLKERLKPHEILLIILEPEASK